MMLRHRKMQTAITGYQEDHGVLGPILQAHVNGTSHDGYSLAHETGIPRTTLRRQVLRLSNAGVVHQMTRGRATILQVRDDEWDRILPVSDDAIDDVIMTAKLIEEIGSK